LQKDGCNLIFEIKKAYIRSNIFIICCAMNNQSSDLESPHLKYQEFIKNLAESDTALTEITIQEADLTNTPALEALIKNMRRERLKQNCPESSATLKTILTIRYPPYLKPIERMRNYQKHASNVRHYHKSSH